MATIEQLPIAAEVGTGRLWPEVAARLGERLAAHRVSPREAVVLVPYAALIDPLRRALAAGGGWQPRVETAATLAATLAPPPAREPGVPCGDAVLDRLQARALLRNGAHLPLALPPAHGAALFADAAQVLAAEAALQPPAARAAWRERLRAELAPSGAGVGSLEAALLAVAAQWAEQAPPPATDALFDLAPAAWVVLRIGGADRLAEALLPHAQVLGLRVDLDTEPPPRWPAAAPGLRLRRLVADDLEAEAMAAAGSVLEALAAGAARVALVALDRALTRRIIALLARRGVPVSDETGWRLSTTPTAARLLARLRAMAPEAGADACLDWLKTSQLGERQAWALERLEVYWRDGRRGPGFEPPAAVPALLRQIDERRAPWQGAGERPFADWLALLREQLDADGDSEAWRTLPGGEALLRLLDRTTLAAPALGPGLRFDLDGFTAWFESACEAVDAEPPLGGSGAPVVVSPLARVIGRHFDEVVLPGADELRLGAIEPADTLLGEVRAERLGLSVAARQRRQRRQLALAQLLRVPGLTLTRRRYDREAALAASPDIESLEQAALAAGHALPAEQIWQPKRAAVARRPEPRPAPAAADALPARLSASAVEALRACPYRFYARHVLALAPVEELDTAPGKREYGTWLHEALHHFHRQRSGADDAGELHAAADAAIARLGLDRASLLPFRASVDALVPAYLRWLAAHEHEGWRWQEAEVGIEVEPEAWAPQRAHGIVDRIDAGPGGASFLIDYKTGSHESLRKRVAVPLEDTQLAFYAALLCARAGGEAPKLKAAYLALDEKDGPRPAEHADVAHSAQALLHGLGSELERLRLGAPLPALGEGEVCATCEARGLCRRDHWAEAVAP